MRDKDLTADFAAETRQIVARRMPYAVVAFTIIMGSAWVFEHASYPERDHTFAYLYFIEIAVLAAAAALARPFSRFSVEIAAGSLLVVSGLIGYYHVATSAEPGILALALAFLTVGTTAFVPWGPRGQVPLGIGVVVVYAIVIRFVSGPPSEAGIGFVGLASISGLSISAAYLLHQYRLREFEQTRELERTNAALRRANEAKNDFVAAVSHELRTPLSSIMGYTDLLHEDTVGVLPDEAHVYLGRISTNASQLLRLINDLIDLSRLESGRLDFDLQPVPLAPLFEEMSELAGSLLRSRPIRFSTAGADGLVVRGDPQRLRQVLTNLLSNASKYTERGEIALRARPEPGEIVSILVEDSGVGIAADEIELIFEPFRRGSRKREVTGFGIGLSLSSRLVESMGGGIRVESDVGRGSTFTVNLPAAEQGGRRS